MAYCSPPYPDITVLGPFQHNSIGPAVPQADIACCLIQEINSIPPLFRSDKFKYFGKIIVCKAAVERKKVIVCTVLELPVVIFIAFIYEIPVNNPFLPFLFQETFIQFPPQGRWYAVIPEFAPHVFRHRIRLHTV